MCMYVPCTCSLAAKALFTGLIPQIVFASGTLQVELDTVPVAELKNRGALGGFTRSAHFATA